MKDLVGGGEPPGLVAPELEEEVVKLHAISADDRTPSLKHKGTRAG